MKPPPFPSASSAAGVVARFLVARGVDRIFALCGGHRAFANAPALLDVLITTDAVSSDAKSGLAWVPDLQPLAAWDAAERNWRQG